MFSSSKFYQQGLKAPSNFSLGASAATVAIRVHRPSFVVRRFPSCFDEESIRRLVVRSFGQLGFGQRTFEIAVQLLAPGVDFGPRQVAVIDGERFTLLELIPVGQRPWGIALTPDGRKLYTANGISSDVTVIDTTTNKVITTIKVGDGPWGIAL